MFDCIVVGAGPVGSYFAKELAKEGLKVLVLEEHETVGEPVHCTGVIGQVAFNKLKLPQESIVSSIDHLKFISPGFHNITLTKGQTWAHVVNRAVMDKLIAQEAKSAGVEIVLKSKVVDVKEDEKNVFVTLENGEKILGKFCILATGSMCALPYNLGFMKPWYFLKGAQIETEFKVYDNSTCDIFLGETLSGGDFIWTVPLNGNRARIGICSRYNAKNYLEVFLSKHYIKDRILSPYKIELGIVPIGGIEEKGLRYKRIATLGDAAGQVKLTTAGGIALGIKMGMILKESIMEGCGMIHLPDGFLSKYYRNVRRSIGTELLVGDFFRKLFLKLKDEDWDGIIRLANDPRLLDIIQKKSEFDKHSRLILWFLSNKQYRKIFFKHSTVSIFEYIKQAVLFKM